MEATLVILLILFLFLYFPLKWLFGFLAKRKEKRMAKRKNDFLDDIRQAIPSDIRYVASLEEVTLLNLNLEDYRFKGADRYIGIDEVNNLLVFAAAYMSSENKNKPERKLIVLPIKISDIIGIEVADNGGTHASMAGAGSSIAAGIIGGLIAGGAGAMVGAISTKGNQKIQMVNLIVTQDNIKEPILMFDFLNLPLINFGSADHQNATFKAKEWYAKVSVLITRINKKASLG